MRLYFRVLVVLIAIFGCSTALWCQEVTGSIAGTVKDQTGAVVSGATVTITNTDKNVVVRTLTTASNGDYSAPLLPIGHYSVAVEASGFKKTVETGIELNVNDKLTIALTLELGGAQETVTVEASPLQVELQSATAGNVVSGTQIRELALTSRNYAQLVSLVPGVSSTSSTDQMYVGAFSPIGTNVVTFSMNGGRTSQNNWTIDGFDNVDRGANLTLLSFPSVDAISEFKVLRGQYEPEFGRAGGGQVSVVTRSGTSAFHGGGYEFFRNNVLNANSFFNNAGGIKRPLLRYNNFGWTVGGPAFIPGVYNTARNKTFFFFSQEFRRVITYSNPTGTIATANERQGIFSHPVCIQRSGTKCDDANIVTRIPSTSFSRLASAYLQDIWSHVPLPNDTTDPHLLRSSLRNVFNFREELIKIDHVFGPKLTMNGKILRDNIPTIEPGGLFTTSPLPGISTTSTNSPGHNYTINTTAALSPRLLINAGYGYSYGAILSRVLGLLNSTTAPNIKPNMPFPNSQGRVPNISLTGGAGLSTFGPYDDLNFNHTAHGSVSRIVGSHTFKAGITYYHYRKTENAGSGPQGSFSFNNARNPNPCPTPPTATCTLPFEQAWANFLVGSTSSFNQANIDITPDIQTNQIEMYGQDQYRVLPNLTLSYGVRYSLFRQPTDAKGLLSNFDPRAYDPSKVPCIGLDGNIDPTCGASSTPGLTEGSFDALNGLVFQGKNAFYGGKVSSEDNKNIAPRIGLVWDPFKDGKTAIRAGYGLFYDAILFGNYEINIFNNPPTVQTVIIPNTSFDDPRSGTPSVSRAPKRLRSLGPTPYRSPYSEQYSLDVQRDLGRGFLLDVGYYGSQAHHLIGQIDINQPQPNAYRTQIRQCSSGVTTNCLAPGAFIVSDTTPLLNRIRPFRGYVGIDANRSDFNSNYNSFQLQMQKRFRSNSLVNIAYTWSRSMTDNQTDRSTAAQDSYCAHNCEYGPSQSDRRHIFTANFIYDLPFFKAQQGLTGHLLGGWEFSGIVTAQTGTPITILTLANQDPTGQGCLGPSPCSVRPDMIGNPNAAASHTFSQWFDTSTFRDVPAGQFRNGTSPRGGVRGPGFWRTDLALFKTTQVTERVSTQLRVESLNTFNHTNPVCCGSTSLGSSSFGKILSTRDPRVVQLGLKLNF
ncbi:MAG TPA: TonB-dependent receptor [Candidatus Dormibacteraeota bacterium]|nr:TonB-dependent receptor [Candidatus Dormibacteraeota bacterium]